MLGFRFDDIIAGLSRGHVLKRIALAFGRFVEVDEAGIFWRVDLADLEAAGGGFLDGVDGLLENHGVAAVVPEAVDFFDQPDAGGGQVEDASALQGEGVDGAEFEGFREAFTAFEFEGVVVADGCGHGGFSVCW